MNMHVGEAVAVDSVVECAGVKDLPLGAIVDIVGVVVGRSEFESGSKTYCVQFEVKGKPTREWFFAEDLEEAR